MAWLEIHQSLLNHRKTLEAAESLNLKPVYLLGHIVSLWLWALDNAPTGTLGHIKPQTLARVMDWSDDPQSLLGVLIDVGFLDETGDGLVIHDWWQYAGKLIERREQNVQRMRAKRATSVQNTCAARAQNVRNTCDARAPATQHNTTQHNSTEQNSNVGNSADDAEAQADPVFLEGSPPHDLAELLRGLILGNNPQAKVRNQTEKQFQTWCAEIDRMIRLDGRSSTDIDAVIRWAQDHDFWRANILSPPKLREKWDTLWLQMQRPNKEVKRNGSIKQRLAEVDDPALDRFKAFD